ncbi:chemotaxis protein CheW [Gemmata sp. JC673]|uniref:Chemotaxis protein CheW n=1 Tax=Gemmata algarum TaxID=2975278 RepID=A0ABU5ERI0_9BACT|nr:chemotaxis protein CheW [Gemmata algarum]MDY3557946.1 chemotaxis protein CheW [Gemmata algarum]
MAEQTSALRPPAGDGAGEAHELVTCVLGGVEFGIDISAVQEIVRRPKITPVPRAPRYVEGVANLRGNVLPIVNSRARFGMPPADNADNNRVVVVELNGAPTGLIVDAVREVMHVRPSDVERAPAAVQSVDGRFLRGVVKLNGGQRLVLLLDHNSILDAARPADDAAPRGPDPGADPAASGAALRAAAVRAEEHEHLVTFRVGAEEYGVPIMDVQEIIRVPPISTVPNAPAGVVGIASLRNRILPVLDLRAKFGLPPLPKDARRGDERCLVVGVGGAALALRVDAVNQVLQVPQATVERTPPIMGGGAGDTQVRGIAKLNGGKRLIMLLAVEKLVTQSELSAMTETSGRAEQGAGAAESDERQLVTFKVADEEFAVDIMQVQEIVRLGRVTKVPHVPEFVEGVVNLRGSVLPVIDLRKRVHLARKDYSDATRVVVVDLGGSKTGIIVDAVSEVMRVRARDLEPAPPIVRSRYGDHIIEGVGKLNRGDRMFLLLRADELLKAEAA